MKNPKNEIDIYHPMLCSLENDIREINDALEEHPEMATELFKLLKKGKNNIGGFNELVKVLSASLVSP